MATHAGAGVIDTVLKPSTATTTTTTSRSATHSPAQSPSHMPLFRDTTTLKTGNWQAMWAPGSSPSQRTPSGSSVVSSSDLTSHNSLSESWAPSSRSTGTNWDESRTASPHKTPSPLGPSSTLQPSRRPSGVGSRPSISPKPYELNMSRGSTNDVVGRYPSASSPAGTKAGSTYGSNPSYPTSATAAGGGHDLLLQPQSSNVDDLTLSLHGLTVDDDYSPSPATGLSRASQQPSSTASVPIPRSAAHAHSHTRIPSTGQIGRLPYATEYPTHNGAAYYPAGHSVEYPYGYHSPDPSVYGSSASTSPATAMYPATPQMPQATMTSAPYYDFARSQFFYGPPPPHAQMIYPAPGTPIVASQMTPTAATAAAAMRGDVKPMTVEFPQMYPGLQGLGVIRSSPSPNGATSMYGHPAHVVHGAEYASQMPLAMLPAGAPHPYGIVPAAAAYGINAAAVHVGGMRPAGIAAGVGSNGQPNSVRLRSPLLDEFRANKSKKWELKDIFDYVVEFSGDQHGSRFIQQKLETATPDERERVFAEIVPASVLPLSQDVFGNYVIQRLFEFGDQVQKTVLASALEGQVLALSMQMYGCRVVQKAIECVLPDQQMRFVYELEPHILRLVKDANGNHVVQKLIERVSPDRLGFVHVFRGHVYDLATHSYGCRVLQRCFEHLPDDYVRPLLDELHTYLGALMQDQFGNYVVQFLLERGSVHDRVMIVQHLRWSLLQMARHKFASNVCEKALVCADSEGRRLLIDEIMSVKPDGTNTLMVMMKDQYANYVVQRALTAAETEQKEVFIAKVRPQLAALRRFSGAHTKHLISIERTLAKVVNAGAADASITA